MILSISNNFMRLGVLAALVGMSLGVWMGSSQNFTLRPVHAHINLLGFASMMLFGFFYRAYPAVARTRLAMAHFVLAVAGFLISMPMLTLILLGQPVFMPLLPVSEVMLVGSMLIFVVIVFQATSAKEATT